MRIGVCGQVSENLHEGSLGPTETQSSLLRDFRGPQEARTKKIQDGRHGTDEVTNCFTRCIESGSY